MIHTMVRIIMAPQGHHVAFLFSRPRGRTLRAVRGPTPDRHPNHPNHPIWIILLAFHSSHGSGWTDPAYTLVVEFDIRVFG